MHGTFWSLIPPITVLIVAFSFRTMNLAFFSGIVTAAYIASQGSLQQACAIGINRLCETFFNSDNLFLYGFLIIIGSLIALFNTTGSLKSLTILATKRFKSGRQAETASIFFSFLLFVDDYLSILTTAHVMQPITQRFGIPRVKVAYLVHSLAGSVVILAPISSWVATITAQLGQAGINPKPIENTYIVADPFFIYLKTIPYIFYSFLTIASVVYIVRNAISYGPMHSYEKRDELADTSQQNPTSNNPMSLWGIIFPLITLLSMMFIGILYSGNFWLFGGNNSLIESVKNSSSPFFIMFLSALTALISGIIVGAHQKRYSIIHVPSTLFNGWLLMKDAILMVFLSSTLAMMLKNDILTGQYLALLFIGSVSVWLLPSLFFIVSFICALATGSAWGTFSLMLSIAIPMVTTVLNNGFFPANPEAVALLFPVLGAIFSGAVCGDHISPISETTIMASTSCGTSPLLHAYTQFPYALPAIISSLVAFLIAGYYVTKGDSFAAVYALGVAGTLCLATLRMLSRHNS